MLGCVIRALEGALFTQPSPHVFLHFCMIFVGGQPAKNLVRDERTRRRMERMMVMRETAHSQGFPFCRRP